LELLELLEEPLLEEPLLEEPLLEESLLEELLIDEPLELVELLLLVSTHTKVPSSVKLWIV
jgi:hypothetical protein